MELKYWHEISAQCMISKYDILVHGLLNIYLW